MVMVVTSHAGEFPGETAEGAGNGLPLACLDSLWRDVGVDGRESVHPLIDISRKHHRACGVAPVVDGICQCW